MIPLPPSPLTDLEARTRAARNGTTLLHEHTAARAEQRAPDIIPAGVAPFAQREAKLQKEKDKLEADKLDSRNLVLEWEDLCAAAVLSGERIACAKEHIAILEKGTVPRREFITENIGKPYSMGDIQIAALNLLNDEGIIAALTAAAVHLGPKFKEDTAALLAFAKKHGVPREQWPEIILSAGEAS